MSWPKSACELTPQRVGADDRRRAVVRWATTLSWVWLVPLAGAAAVAGYLSLIFVGFLAEGLGGEVTAWVLLLALGLPALALLLAATAGLGTAWMLARWTSRFAPLARVSTWLLGMSTAVLGALVAAPAFYAVMAGANWLDSR